MSDAGVAETAAVEGGKTAGEAGAAEVAGSGAAAAGGAAETAGVVGATAASGAGAGYGAVLETGAGLGGALESAGKFATSPLGATVLGETGAAVTTSLLAPKPPGAPKPIPMPDPLAQENAKRQAVIEQLARRGRASTILTSPGNSLGG